MEKKYNIDHDLKTLDNFNIACLKELENEMDKYNIVIGDDIELNGFSGTVVAYGYLDTRNDYYRYNYSTFNIYDFGLYLKCYKGDIEFIKTSDIIKSYEKSKLG